jgi:hypothetical protein
VALHDDLLAQADRLAHAEKKKPKQASLRRAVSAAYYALFHYLVDESTHFLVSGKQREALRRQLARSFDHAQMKKAAQAFVAPSASSPWRAVLSAAPTPALVDVASAFIALQEARHEADYDLARVFTRVECNALVGRSQAAFTTWATVAGSEEADAFLIALLVRGRP